MKPSLTCHVTCSFSAVVASVATDASLSLQIPATHFRYHTFHPIVRLASLISQSVPKGQSGVKTESNQRSPQMGDKNEILT